VHRFERKLRHGGTVRQRPPGNGATRTEVTIGMVKFRQHVNLHSQQRNHKYTNLKPF
jgi:hypothetical protein